MKDENTNITAFPLEHALFGECFSNLSLKLKEIVYLMLRILETLKIRYLHDINSIQVVLFWQNLFILQFRPKLADFREGKKNQQKLKNRES